MVSEMCEVVGGTVTDLSSPPCFLKYCRIQASCVAWPGWPWLQTMAKGRALRKDNRNGRISKTTEVP